MIKNNVKYGIICSLLIIGLVGCGKKSVSDLSTLEHPQDNLIIEEDLVYVEGVEMDPVRVSIPFDVYKQYNEIEKEIETEVIVIETQAPIIEDYVIEAELTQVVPIETEVKIEETIIETETETEIQETETVVVETETEVVETEAEAETESGSPYLYSPSDFQFAGVLYWGGYSWTWYSQNVLPGGGLNIPGRHVDELGYVCDGNGYICLASSDLGWGTVVNTPFGKPGCVYDCGCASGILDVYVAW